MLIQAAGQAGADLSLKLVVLIKRESPFPPSIPWGAGIGKFGAAVVGVVVRKAVENM